MKAVDYRKILEKVPAGVFVFDGKLRILCANDAFLRAFCADIVATKTKLYKNIAIPFDEFFAYQSNQMGENQAYTSFHKVMQAAIEEGTEQSDTIFVSAKQGNNSLTMQMHIRVVPVDEQTEIENTNKKRKIKEEEKLFLGLAEGVMQSEIAREMLTAKQMQQRLLPAGKQSGGVPYAYMYIPCLEIGGDLPDVYECGGNVYGVLSDVSGKGISAGMLSAFIRAGFDRKAVSVAQAVTSLRDKFVELNPDERSYITVAAVCIDKVVRQIHFVIAGHNAPILLKDGQGINEIEDPAPPVSNWITEYQYTEKSIDYKAGNILVLLSDGVTECPNTAGDRFGIERTESVLLQSVSAEDFIGKLKNALTVFSGGTFTDDITAMAFDL